MQIRITSIRARNGGEEILLGIELCGDVFDALSGAAEEAGERETRELSLLPDRYIELRPARGVIDEAFYRELELAARFSEAVRCGLRILAYGANTRRVLESKLQRHGVARETAHEAALYLSERGYFSEEEDAVREAERGVARLRGRNRIRAALYEKGYGGEALTAADRYLEGVDFVALCVRLIEKRYAALLADPAEHKRMAATLMRNGYTMEEIRAAVRALR